MCISWLVPTLIIPNNLQSVLLFFSGNQYLCLAKYQVENNELGEWLRRVAAPFRIEVSDVTTML